MDKEYNIYEHKADYSIGGYIVSEIKYICYIKNSWGAPTPFSFYIFYSNMNHPDKYYETSQFGFLRKDQVEIDLENQKVKFIINKKKSIKRYII